MRKGDFLIHCLKEFEDLFQGKLGTMPGEPYRVPIKKTAKPYHAKPFPVPVIYQDTLKKELNRLEDLGVITKDKDSQWAAPAFIIPKKNGTVRFLTDFRRLNSQLNRHPYPLPKIQDLLQSVPKFSFVTTLDLNMGYYSTPIHPDDAHYLAFVVPWGKYKYLRLPMGINTAPDEFQARMMSFFGDLSYVRVYLDDLVIITTGSAADHIEQLRQVFHRSRSAGMQINAAKCNFLAFETEYLGFQLTRNGIKPLPSKVAAMRNIAIPTTRKELRSFLGLVNYYRDMWPLRAHTLAPLSSLTSTSVPFKWKDTHTTAFNAIKALITHDVMLAYPDFSLPFEIFTDASTFQLGGTITQNKKLLLSTAEN